jgi:hypothetical protein
VDSTSEELHFRSLAPSRKDSNCTGGVSIANPANLTAMAGPLFYSRTDATGIAESREDGFRAS